MKIYFSRSNVKSMFSLSLSLLSSVLLFTFSQLCFLPFLCWIDSLSPFCSVRFLYCSFSLSPYIFWEHFQKKVKQKTEGDEEEKGQEESYQSRHRGELVDS